MRRVLVAGYQALGAEDASIWVDVARYRVDGEDVLGFRVPGTVFAPVGCANFFPAVLEGAVCVEDFHLDGIWVVTEVLELEGKEDGEVVVASGEWWCVRLSCVRS